MANVYLILAWIFAGIFVLLYLFVLIVYPLIARKRNRSEEEITKTQNKTYNAIIILMVIINLLLFHAQELNQSAENIQKIEAKSYYTMILTGLEAKTFFEKEGTPFEIQLTSNHDDAVWVKVELQDILMRDENDKMRSIIEGLPKTYNLVWEVDEIMIEGKQSGNNIGYVGGNITFDYSGYYELLFKTYINYDRSKGYESAKKVEPTPFKDILVEEKKEKPIQPTDQVTDILSIDY